MRLDGRRGAPGSYLLRQMLGIHGLRHRTHLLPPVKSRA